MYIYMFIFEINRTLVIQGNEKKIYFYLFIIYLFISYF